MLFSYQQRVQLLLADVKQVTFNPADLTTYINTARGQVAGDGECVRRFGTLAITQNTQGYPFGQISGLGSDVSGPINVRNMQYALGAGFRYITPKSFEWFSLYYFDNPLAPQGPPNVWAQLGQGTAGTLYFGPVPDMGYTLQCDTVCNPIALTLDSSAEALPQFWQDAVPFLAAWYALMSAQASGVNVDPDKMYQRYETFKDRARRFATPSVLPGIYPQTPDLVAANRFGQANVG